MPVPGGDTPLDPSLLTAAPPLPAALAPAGPAPLLGAWVAQPADPSLRDRPGVTFTTDGHYTTSDGCNSSQGAYRVRTDGAFIATSGIISKVGCTSIPVPSWLALARRAGLNGQRLALLDAHGQTLGQLVPAPGRRGGRR